MLGHEQQRKQECQEKTWQIHKDKVDSRQHKGGEGERRGREEGRETERENFLILFSVHKAI